MDTTSEPLDDLSAALDEIRAYRAGEAREVGRVLAAIRVVLDAPDAADAPESLAGPEELAERTAVLADIAAVLVDINRRMQVSP